jgi:hypothetical protein
LMDSRQRFVLVYSAAVFVPFTIFTFLNTNDVAVYVSSYTIVYFALRLTLNPKIRLKVDLLGLLLLAAFLYFVAQRVFTVFGG